MFSYSSSGVIGIKIVIGFDTHFKRISKIASLDQRLGKNPEPTIPAHLR